MSFREQLIDSKYIPFDKSWMIRMGVLDMLNGRRDTIDFLSKQRDLSDDLKTLETASHEWLAGDENIYVGESGTLYRFLQFASWKNGLNKQFIKTGTLNGRKMTNDPAIVNFSLEDLAQLDNNTSQWASAAVLFGSKEQLPNPAYKLQLTYDAVKHWREQRQQNKIWSPRYDETILKQAEAFLELINTGATKFRPVQAEDYCFGRIFGSITPEEALIRWPSLQGHESNRIESMEVAIEQIRNEETVDSKDHRVVQAVGMYTKYKNMHPRIQHPESVSKSWPQFWLFLSNISKFYSN